jgi:hypothetical protein
MITVGKLRKVLESFDNDDAQVWINISGTMFPMCGKTMRSFLIYEDRNAPGMKKGETAFTVQPCDCSSEEEDKKKGDELHFN